jgi:hypothetical protein
VTIDTLNIISTGGYDSFHPAGVPIVLSSTQPLPEVSIANIVEGILCTLIAVYPNCNVLSGL